MRVRHVMLGVILSAGCVGVSRRQCEDTLWVLDTPRGPCEFASRYDAYDPGRYRVDPSSCVGEDDGVILFTTRMQSSPGAFACAAGHQFWHDRDVVGYAPTGRVADPRTRDGREWHEYRLLGGPKDSPRVAEAISKQRFGRLDRP